MCGGTGNHISSPKWPASCIRKNNAIKLNSSAHLWPLNERLNGLKRIVSTGTASANDERIKRTHKVGPEPIVIKIRIT